ncbi:hypothetical protein C6Q02_01065 [Burkholderia multivorans]|uniref:hypothetical protein n=1 Tax=Burkholderia multivorans TaxID=87883 RepID=UPI000CFF9FC8|nr:hypothetical protein [Burkholderia multivorans]PRE93274.1 hypothetical protein C6Q02_01065 [Burkholderia multivorans]
MGLFDALCDYVLCPIGSVVKDTVEGAAAIVDSTVNAVIIDGICGGIDSAIETIEENPGKAAATVLTVGITAAANAMGKSDPTAGILAGAIGYGSGKVDGSHDHRYNKGPDRTPAQKAGDAARKKK